MSEQTTIAIFAIVIAALALLAVVAIVYSMYYTNPALLAARPPPQPNGTFFSGCQPNSKPFNASGGNCAHIHM
jgi:hypothetical protein